MTKTVKRADPNRMRLRREDERSASEVARELIAKYGFTQKAADRLREYLDLEEARHSTIH